MMNLYFNQYINLQRHVNNIQMSIFALTFLLLLILHTLSQCPANTKLDNVETAIISAGSQSSTLPFSQTSNQFEYMYPLKNNHITTPQVALALNSFDGLKVSGFSFQIMLAQTTTTSLQLRLVTPWETTRWNSLKFIVLVNSRTDFQVGIFNPQNWTPNNNQINITFYKTYSNTSQLVTRSFLAGISILTNSSIFSIQMMQLSVSSSSFTVGVATNAAIRNIQVSYLVFQPSVARFASFGGIASQPSVQTPLYQSVQISLSSLNNQLFGITGFSSSDSTGRFSLDVNIDSNFILGISGNTQNITVSFVIFGQNPNKVCSNCPNTIPSYDQCVQTCSNSQAVFTYPDQSKSCINCPEYAHLRVNPLKTSCICQQGYYLVRGVCMPNTVTGQQNSISSLFGNLSAQALQSQFFNSAINTPIVQTRTVTTSTALQNVNSQQQFLQQYPTQNSNSQNLVCSDPNSYLSNNQCFCLPGFYIFNNACQKCPDGSYYNGSACITTSQPQIQQTTTLQQSQQITTSQPNILPPGAVPLGNYSPNPNTNNPNTNANYINSSGSLDQANTNVTIMAGSEQISVVIPGQNNNVSVINVPDGVDPSVYFPPGLIPENIIIINVTDSGASSPSYPPSRNNSQGYGWWYDYYFNGYFNWNGNFYNRNISCPANEYLNNQRMCVCIPGFIRDFNGYCLRYNPNNRGCNMQYAYINGQGYCVCQIGYAFNLNYLCVKINTTTNCPLGGTLQIDGTCICMSPFVNSQGICILCADGSYWNGNTCIIACPSNYVFNQTSGRCVCAPGYYESAPYVCLQCPNNGFPFNNICSYCPVFSIRVGSQCECQIGAQIQNTICQPICPYWSYYNSVLQKCICIQQNYYVDTTNTCVPCPIGTIFDGSICFPCAPPNWYDRNNKLCLPCIAPSFIYNGVCIRCPQNSQWLPSIARCQCISGFAVIGGTCKPSQTCPGGVFIGGICVTCRNGRVVGTTCECNPGFVFVGGACIQNCPQDSIRTAQGVCVYCPQNSQWDVASQRCFCLPGYALNPFQACVRQCPVGSSLIGGQCVCNPGFYLVPALNSCATCPPQCITCVSANQCTSCSSGVPPVGGICGGTAPIVCVRPLQSCTISATKCCSCMVPNCLSCIQSNMSYCQNCATGYIRNITTGQCIPGGDPTCNPACPVGFICLLNLYCVREAGNVLTINLISVITSSIRQSSFIISITPNVVYYQARYSTNVPMWTSQSKNFVKIVFEGLTARQVPRAACTQNTTNIANWNCIIEYYNQPIGVPYNMIMTAVNPSNTTQTGYLLLTINPVQASSSISDATVLMRTPGSLVTITTMSNSTIPALIIP